MSKIDFEQAAADGFVGLNKDELREAAKVFDTTIPPNAGEAYMRDKLCAVVGKPATRMDVMPKGMQERQAMRGFDPKPNLTSMGRWGGRYQRVILQNTNTSPDSHQAGIPVGWEGNVIYLFFGRELDIPEPHFNVISSTRGAHLQPRRRTREDGTVEVYNVEIPYQPVPFQHIGVTPGTEDLPVSNKDYWQRQAKKNNLFANTPRGTLMKIRADLLGQKGREFYKDLTDDDIRDDILVKLNMAQELAA